MYVFADSGAQRKRRLEIVEAATKEYKKTLTEEAAERTRELRKKEADAKCESSFHNSLSRTEDLNTDK